MILLDLVYVVVADRREGEATLNVGVREETTWHLGGTWKGDGGKLNEKTFNLLTSY